EKVDARVISIDSKTRKISLSIKQREIAEEKEAVAEFGSSESGASLGDILGAAFSKAAAEKARQSDDDQSEDSQSEDAADKDSPEDESADKKA
ncbi:MAG: hypothetical protein R3245_11660, partial [Kiloniellales bacterium]|nr:hypothetical protein [Kiloniellales bacterium]